MTMSPELSAKRYLNLDVLNHLQPNRQQGQNEGAQNSPSESTTWQLKQQRVTNDIAEIIYFLVHVLEDLSRYQAFNVLVDIVIKSYLRLEKLLSTHCIADLRSNGILLGNHPIITILITPVISVLFIAMFGISTFSFVVLIIVAFAVFTFIAIIFVPLTLLILAVSGSVALLYPANIFPNTPGQTEDKGPNQALLARMYLENESPIKEGYQVQASTSQPKRVDTRSILQRGSTTKPHEVFEDIDMMSSAFIQRE